MSVVQLHKPPSMPNDLESFWMPFTANRAFKERPRMVSRAKDLHYYTPEGRPIFDGAAGLWCCNAGHNREPIVKAIQAQAAEMDFSPTFQFGHPKAFELASRIAALAPDDLDHVFFANSGSEAVDTALKVAIAYWQTQGMGQKTRLIGRERGYHGVGFGGISVGGMVANRKTFGAGLAGTDHISHTYNRGEQAFSKGEPEWGAHLADDLERLVALHDASTIAAVIVEPMAGSTGVLPPPKGYLKRLRELCTKHNILLIFDEVITGFGRLGTPFAAERFGVTPDIMTFAKGVTSGSVPMGGIIARKHIHDAFMKGPKHVIELFHGYTYSAHPLACAAGLATLDLYRDEGIFENAAAQESDFADMALGFKNTAGILDVRTIGITAAFDMAPKDNSVGVRGFDALNAAFHDAGMMVRVSGDTVCVSPPLTIKKHNIGDVESNLKKIFKLVF